MLTGGQIKYELDCSIPPHSQYIYPSLASLIKLVLMLQFPSHYICTSSVSNWKNLIFGLLLSTVTILRQLKSNPMRKTATIITIMGTKPFMFILDIRVVNDVSVLNDHYFFAANRPD